MTVSFYSALSWLQVVAILAAAAPQQIPLGRLTHSGAPPTAPPSEYGNDSILIADEAFEQYIQDKIDKWHVPGLAIALLHGNKTWARGFGYATLGSTPVPVTPSTLFYCGSMTKSFTAASLSLLVDDSRNYSDIDWTTPISRLLHNDFVLADPWATQHVTVADALSHRTGYPRHDYSGPFHNSSAKMVQAFRHLPMANEPRARWEYNNMMYGTMGYLVETLSGSTLADFLHDRLWRPMGMFDTYLHPDDALLGGSHLARPYYWNNDTESYGEIPWRDETNIAGAGMAISSILDWSRYLRHMIDESGPISKEGHHSLKFPHMVCKEGNRLFTGPSYYGFGWFGSVFQDERVYWHSGLVDSMMSLMVMVPSKRFGFIVMMNSEGMPALDSIIAKSLYDFFDVPEEKRTDMEAKFEQAMEEHWARLGNCSTRLFPSLPSPPLPAPLPLEDFSGEYFHRGYGPLSILLRCSDWDDPSDSPASPSVTADGCRLVAVKTSVFGKQISYQLEHKTGDFWIGWGFNDDFATVRRPTQCSRVQFRVDERGRPSSVGLDIREEGEDVPLTWFERIE